jgi:hypothetical protein
VTQDQDKWEKVHVAIHAAKVKKAEESAAAWKARANAIFQEANSAIEIDRRHKQYRSVRVCNG